jgi:hypothetical protein
VHLRPWRVSTPRYEASSRILPVEQAFYTSAVDNLREITFSRRERIQQSQEGLSPLLRFLLIIGAIVFIVLAYPASVRKLGTRIAIVGAKDAGEIEWRLLKTPGGEPKKLDGRWRYGTEQPWRGGWDLTKLDARSEPPDLAAMFDDPSSFCHHP